MLLSSLLWLQISLLSATAEGAPTLASQIQEHAAAEDDTEVVEDDFKLPASTVPS